MERKIFPSSDLSVTAREISSIRNRAMDNLSVLRSHSILLHSEEISPPLITRWAETLKNVSGTSEGRDVTVILFSDH